MRGRDLCSSTQSQALGSMTPEIPGVESHGLTLQLDPGQMESCSGALSCKQ
ncbi:tubulin tyrosine ligase like 2 [Homo sapiens]|uniref:Tubulin tyrosine ligase like 2 n=1 Tax=Homo sapiens TaxID=9606 RepID=D6R9R4_HUMAN|nr:tubulin tyrosine ligase like 2 [Homo sapiens]